MLGTLIVILVILWFLGYVHINGLNIPDTSLFVINGQNVTIIDLLILALVATAISILPSPIREVCGILLILWILSVLGILSIAGLGLANIFVLAILVGLVLALFRRV